MRARQAQIRAVLFAFGLLAGAAAMMSYSEHHRLEKAMRAALFEPDTAGFSAFPAARGKLRKAPPVICGDVDAKNHRGYVALGQKYLFDRRTGETAFQSDLVLARDLYPARGDWPREAKFLKDWDAVCRAGALDYAQIRRVFDWRKSSTPSQWDWSLSNGAGGSR